jgi:hypothetical protein
MTLKANTYDFLTKNGLHHNSKNLIYDIKTYVGWGVRVSGWWSMATQPPFFVANSHEWTFSIIPKVNTYGFLPTKSSALEIQECDLWQGNICGVRCTILSSMINGHTTPIFIENSHERPFIIIMKANTYGFLTKKLSPPKIQECNLRQGNICGMWCTSLWSMIKGHTTPIFVENSHEGPFSIIPMAHTYGFLTKKWSPPKIQECDLWQGKICGVRCTSL